MNKNELTLGSLFSGSGGFELAGILAGIRPIWASEVDPFCIRVTTKRMPEVKHYGDVSALHGGDLDPVDIITFGSPCQNMSLAGKRAGLHGEQSSLFFEAIRIIKEMRKKTNGEYPRYICWENVFGAFSSNKGEDFRQVLQEIIQINEPEAEVPPPDKDGWPYADAYMGNGWSVAYRLMDSQGWGVPQRRRRIYLVGDLRGQGAGKILFESESMSGYLKQGGLPWKRTARDIKEGSEEAGSGFDQHNGNLTDDVAQPLTASAEASGNDTQMVLQECPVLDDQGGERMSISEGVTGTLRAETHGHPPVVVDDNLKAAGFCTEHSAKSRGIGYEEGVAPTLRAGIVPATIYENHGHDSRYTGPLDVAPTVSATYGMGGNNQPFVVGGRTDPQVLRMRAGKAGGGKGALVFDNQTGTLGCNNDQTVFVPEQTAFGISSYQSHAMLSENPHAGIYEATTSRTLDVGGGDPGCHQGGICVVEKEKPVAFTENQRSEVRDLGEKSGCISAESGMKQQTFIAEPQACDEEPTAFHVNTRRELIDLHGKSGALMANRSDQMQTFVIQGSMIGRDDKNGPQGDGVNEDVSFTLNTCDRHCVCAEEKPDNPETDVGVYGMTTGSFMEVLKDKSPTLMARDYKDPNTVAPKPKKEQPVYTVRRLTPTECARLQGFPDAWCRNLETPDPTDEEIAFWTDVFETHRKVVTKASKPKTENQIRKWLKDPYSDSAEYRLWGNGISLPVAYFVLSGIVWVDGMDKMRG